MSKDTPNSIKITEVTVERLIDQYSVLLLDAYGVLVHTSDALPGAARLIAELNRMGKPYYILTNDASKLPETAAEIYRRYDLPIDPDKIITSGALLKTYFMRKHLENARCMVLGPDDSVQYVKLAGGRVVPYESDFDVLVVADEAGYPFLETVDTVLTGLFRQLDRGNDIHLVLPNPDLIYPKANKGVGIASGSIALVFEAALQLRYPTRQGMNFKRLGKPQSAIFEEALRRSNTRNMVMIGDQIKTDIQGAIDFGIDSVLVGTGVTRTAPTDFAAHLQPTYFLPSIAPAKISGG